MPASHNDRRIELDLNLEFVDGPRLQASGLRVELSTDAMSDEEVWSLVMRQLGVMRVRHMRILNKRIVPAASRHRGLARPSPTAGRRAHRVDLSHTIQSSPGRDPAFGPWPGFEGLSNQRGASRGHVGMRPTSLVPKSATSLTNPFKLDGCRHADLPLERLVDLPAVTIHLPAGASRAIDRDELRAYQVHRKAVLIDTGWDRLWPTRAYRQRHPFLTADAAYYLLEEEALLVGIDSPHIDDTTGSQRPARAMLLAAGIPICEQLTNLALLPAADFLFSAVPAKVNAVETFSVRAYATLDRPACRERVGSSDPSIRDGAAT